MNSVVTQGIEAAVFRLLSQRRRVAFTLLSHAFPQYTWQLLFQVLDHVQVSHLVVLTPLLWDDEICASEAVVRIEGKIP